MVKKNNVISTGYNQNKTHPLQEKYNEISLDFVKSKAKLHAEIDALISAGNNTIDATLYVYRQGRDGICRLSKPCPACMKMIKDCKIKRVVYTIENGIKEIILN